MEDSEEPNYEETDILIWDKRYLFDCETFLYILGKSVYCHYDWLEWIVTFSSIVKNL